MHHPAKNLIIPDQIRQNAQLYFGDRGREWLTALPALLKETAERWSLHLEAPYPNLSINYVVPAIQADGTPVVLKAGVPNHELSSEAAALRLFNGAGAVRLLEDDIDRGILLLERLSPGTPLAEQPDSLQAVEAAAAVMQRLRRPAPPNHSFPTLADWFSGLTDVRIRFEGGSGPLPPKIFGQAESLARELLSSTQENYVLHGDCHHDNIVDGGERGRLIIDPKGVVGDPAFEVCPFLRNPVDLLERFDIQQALPRRLHKFCELLGFDPQRVTAWALADAVLSACWGLDDPAQSWKGTIAVAEVYAEMLRFSAV